MEIFRDIYAGWEIRVGALSPDEYGHYDSLPFDDYLSVVSDMLDKILEILKLLEEYRLFKLTSYSLIDIDIDVELTDLYQLKGHVLNHVFANKEKRHSILTLNGKTEIYENGTLKEYEDILEVGCEFFIDLITIGTYSDIWLPIDYGSEGNNIYRAKINSLRLEAALMTIKSISTNFTPAEGEIYYGYIAKQVGFRIYYSNSLLLDLSSELQEEIKEFFYKKE